MASTAKIDKWLDLSGNSVNTVVQVQQQVMTNLLSYAPGGLGYNEVAADGVSAQFWWHINDLDCSITPMLPNSKILVWLDIHMGSAYWEIQGLIRRNGIPIGVGDPRGARQSVTFADNNYEASTPNFSSYSVYKSSSMILDEPEYGANRSAFTYSVYLNSYAGYTLFVNRPAHNNNDADYWGQPISTLTLMEVAQ